MKHPFQDLPGDLGPARPVVDVSLLDMPLPPQTCLLDTGATDIRLSDELAQAGGVELGDDLLTTIIVAGYTLTGRGEIVGLEVQTAAGAYRWEATAYFCEDWPFAFGLLGLGGLYPFAVTVCPYEEWSELMPLT